MLKGTLIPALVSMLSIAGAIGAASPAPRGGTPPLRAARPANAADVPAPPVLDEPPALVRDFSLTVTGTVDPVNTDSLLVYRASGTDTAVFRSKIAGTAAVLDTIVVREGDNEIWAVALDTSGTASARSNTVHVRYETIIARIYPEVFRAPAAFEIDTREPAYEATVDLFTVSGEHVARLRKSGSATQFRIDWDLTNGDGRQVRNGAYLAVFTVAGRNGMTVEKHFIAVVR
jgi:hypothetical protein